MKKFLSIIAAVGLTATASTAVVSCATTLKANDLENGAGPNVFVKDMKIDKDLYDKIPGGDEEQELVISKSKDSNEKISGLENVSIMVLPKKAMDNNDYKKSDKIEVLVMVDATALDLKKAKTFEGYIGFELKSDDKDANTKPEFKQIGDFQFKVLPRLDASVKYLKDLEKFGKKHKDDEDLDVTQEQIDALKEVNAKKYKTMDELKEALKDNGLEGILDFFD